MKIYEKIIIDLNTDEILHEESFEYEGEVALCGGGGGSKTTYTESPEQRQLATQQAALLQTQQTESDELKPVQYAAMGIIKDPDTGKLRKMTDVEYYNQLTPEEKGSYDITKKQQERLKLALEGKLPIDEGTQQKKVSEFTAFKEAMARKGNLVEGDSLSDANATSTPGIQSLSELRKYWASREDAQARGEIDSGTANLLNLTRQNSMQEQTAGKEMSDNYTGLLAGYSNLANQYGNSTALRMQVKMQNAANQNALRLQREGSVQGRGMSMSF